MTGRDGTGRDGTGLFRLLCGGAKASGVKPGDHIGEYGNHANRGVQGLDQMTGSRGDEKWRDLKFTWKVELMGLPDGEPRTVTTTMTKILTRS